MPAYRVSHKVRTVAELAEPLTTEGFLLEPFAPGEQPDEEAWVATEVVEAHDFLAALNDSRQRLLPFIDAVAVVTQCAFSLIGMSYMVYRMVENPHCLIYFNHVRRRATVGMILWKPEQGDDISRLLDTESPAALRYFREAMNAATSSACLAMLVITAEALAGQGRVTKRCSRCEHVYEYDGTNHDELLRILGNYAYAQLYKKNQGALRHRLLHGNPIDENAAAQLCDAMYHQILSYVKNTVGLQTIEPIDGAPRRFDSLESLGAILRCKSTAPPSLRDLERNWQEISELIEQPSHY
jgi:hypothetical protein